MTATNTGARISCEGLVRIFTSEDTEVVALQGLDLDVDPGEMLSVVGASGSGKSTMLNILAGLDQPTAGRIRVDEHDLLAMGEPERLAYRRHTIGFVWQQTARNLLPYLGSLDNVLLPMSAAGVGRTEALRRAESLLDLVGLSHRHRHQPEQLSGGEQQRVAIAVALANQPRLLLADEPTGELDVDTAAEIIEVFRTTNTELGVTTLIVTHDDVVARSGQRSITIRDGRVASQRRVNPWAGTFEPEHIVVDRAGRLQLTDDHIATADIGRLVRIEAATDRLTVQNEGVDTTEGDQ